MTEEGFFIIDRISTMGASGFNDEKPSSSFRSSN